MPIEPHQIPPPAGSTILEWVAGALLAVSTAFAGVVLRKNAELSTKVADNNAVISDHEARLQVVKVHYDNLRDDMTEIKEGLRVVHNRISDSSRQFNTKLDTLINRNLDNKDG